MDTIFTDVLSRLSQVPELRFVGEDWGQLNFDQPPVNFPCGLIDLSEVDYSDAGRNRQKADAKLVITIADIRYDGIAAFNPAKVNEQAFLIFQIMEKVNSLIHGYGNEYHSKFSRKKIKKVEREDSIREFRMIYEFRFEDETAMPELTRHPVPPNISLAEYDNL